MYLIVRFLLSHHFFFSDKSISNNFLYYMVSQYEINETLIENTNALFYRYQVTEAEEESYSVPFFVAFLIALNWNQRISLAFQR